LGEAKADRKRRRDDNGTRGDEVIKK